MFKRNLLKRVLPIMLSVAMVFQSVPMTALAVENPEAVVSTTEADPAAEPEADETTSPDGDSGSNSSDDAGGASDSEKVSDETTEMGDGGTETTDTETETETGGTETTDTDAETGDTEAEDINVETGNSESGDGKTEATDVETESNGNETDEDTTQPGQDEQVAVASTEVTVNEGGLSLGSGFVRDNSADRLTYIVPYSIDDLFGNVINVVKDAAVIKVNGESVPALKDDYLILEWKEVKKSEDGAETLVAMTGTPQSVGSYALHLTTRVQEGVCGAVQEGYNVYFNITPRKLTIALEGEDSAEEILSVKAGSKIADFKADVEKAVRLTDDGEKFEDLQYSSTVKVYKVGEEAETTELSFSKDGDYRVKVEVVLDAAAMNNYEVTGGEYLVRFDGLMQTSVDVEIKNPGSEIVKTYEKGKTYKASEIAAEYGLTAVVKAVGADDQDVPLGDDVADADKQAVPKWYTKEINKSENGANIVDFPTIGEVDGITQFFWQNALYTMMTEETVGDVGDYYLVYVYEGVDGRYDKSHSDPVKVAIDPIEVILVPTKVGELNTGMTTEGITKALAEVASELRVPDPVDATLAGAVKSDAPAGDKDFYGVSYDNANVTQYYSPVFELMYKSRTRLPEAQWPAGATEDQKWGEWTKLSRTMDLKTDDDKTQYKYFIRFTGEKGVYTAGGRVDSSSKRPVAEATDSANRNYKVKADSDTLANEKNMLEVTLGEATKTTVDVSAIIAEFNKAGGRGMGGGGLTSEDPAWTVYDPDTALFADRASYKKAVVTSEIKDTHKDITYEWQEGSLNQYYDLTHMKKNEDETDEAFAARKEDAVKALEDSFTRVSTSPDMAPNNAGIYRLHITYKDSALVPKNAPAVGDAYFLIKKQELMLVADTQYAKYGDSVDDFSKQGYRIYAIPGNNESALDLNSAVPLDWQTQNPQWQAMNLKKNADGSDSVEWENSTGTFIKNDTRPYVYKAAVWLNDSDDVIEDTKGERVKNKAGRDLMWSNYTTRNMAAWDEDNKEYRQHYKVDGEFGVIKFDAGEISIVVDRSKLFGDKIYDGKTIADALPEGFVKLTNKATGAEIPATELKVNGEPQDGVGTVRVEWVWSKQNSVRRIVSTDEVRYGGIYTLVAYFEGNDTYGPLRANDDWSDRWVELEDKDGRFEFEIKPLDVEITPILKEEVAAGEPVSEMLEDWHVDVKAVAEDRKIPDGTDGSSDDRWLFECGDGKKWNAVTGKWISYSDSYPILNSGNRFSSMYYEDNKAVNGDERIRYGRRYDVKLRNNNALFAQYDSSYNLTFKSASPANIVRGEAQVQGAGFFMAPGAYEVQGQVSVNTEKDKDGTYKIVPREGIPFVYEGYTLRAWDPQISDWKTVTKDLVTGKEIPLNRNYIAVNIAAPLEFSRELEANGSFAENNFIFGNSIKSANGYVIAEYEEIEYNYEEGEEVNRYYITALFPVELDESGKVVNPEKKFSVTWEEGYTENFNLDLTDAKLEADLKKAVAPKALAFNGVQGKMAVGEEQQLDVKITKAQLGDVIRIRYRLSGGETSNQYASINPETGLITALATNNKKPVAVNVEAYPVRLAADGKTFEEITGKGVKVAKTKVTVTEVTAPVIKKVIPKDVSAEVQFTRVDNGYRGEIYVVKLANKKDANKWKAADFETAIKKMTNGQWQDTFAVAPLYLGGTRGYDEKLKLCTRKLAGLESSAYVVYVRNVSAVRTLADGSRVTESAAGNVKMFETTKSQVKALTPYFEVTAEKTKQNPVRYYNDKDSDDGYIVELADKSAQLLVNGWFFEKPSNAAADSNDFTWFQLSLKAAEKALGIKLTDKYQDPKLTYYVTDGVHKLDDNGKVLNLSKYVTINNKGKLTFKGVDKNGEVRVRVYVKADNSISGYCDLTVTARPDTLTTKKVKTMKVGDAVRLADYLEYKQGKAKVPYHWSSNIEITNWKEVEEAGFEIYQAEDDGKTHPSIDGKLRKGEYIIIATKENSRCDLKFTDWLWKSGTDDKVQTEKSISLATSRLDPVKSLKAVYTDDKHITLNFAHAGHPEAFDIEVKDARGSVIYKKLAYRKWAIGNTISAGAESWEQNRQRSLLESDESASAYGYFRYFEKTRMYAYTISTEKLMRLSSYTISVTPVYEGERAAKSASTKAKTTNIPASYANCDVRDPESNGGIPISNMNTYLTSGNTYTLDVVVSKGRDLYHEPVNELARIRGTDTLTWKSSNTKVASIKANPGSFSATLKAMQQGKTTITVTSKVTKKTIARYHIAVKAVGKGTGYGGDYENGGNGFYDDFIKTVDPYYEGRLEVLTVSNPVNVTDEDMLNSPSNDRTWVQFTAPSYGEYTFNCSSAFRVYYSNGTEKDLGGNTSSQTLRLEEGQKIYFRVEGIFTLSVSSYVDFTKLSTSYTKDKPLKVTRDMWVSFTAQEDNFYTFVGGIEKYEKQPQGNQTTVYSGQFELGMKTGETVFIKVRANSELYVTKRDLSKTLAVGDAGASMSFTKDNAQETQYVRFKADVTGDYSFTYSPSDEIDAKFLAVNDDTEYDDGDAVVAPKAKVMADPAEPGTPAAPASRTVKLFMEGGETIVIAVTVINPAAVIGEKKIDVTVKAATTATKALGGEQTVTKGTSQMFEYTIPDDKAATVYTVAATENAMVEWYYSKTKKETGNSWESDSDTQLGEISDIAYNGNSFTVQNGEVVKPALNDKKALKAGDKIYIKVTAGDTADSKVTLTSVADNKTFDAAAPASIELGANYGDAQWYTFTVKKAGYYEFHVKATAVPAEAAAQSVEVMHVDKAFSDTTRDPYIHFANGTSGVRKLNAGDYVFKIMAASAAAEGVKTTAVLSVKEIVPTAIAKGDTQVTLAKDEVKYYSFKAATNDSYTIKWIPDAESGTADAQYTSGSLESGFFSELPTTVTSSTGTCYVKLTQTGEKAVSGKLQVVTDEKRFLTSGKEETFEIKEDYGSIEYTFTTPEDSKLGYIVIVENTSSADESKNQTMPRITVRENGYGDIISIREKGKASEERTHWDTALTTRKITITAYGVTAPTATEAGISATGKIMIRPVTAQALSTAADKIVKADSKWYTYTIPADGRYLLDYTVGADQDKNSVDVRWYRKMPDGGKGSQINTEAYLEKGQELYVNVKAGDMIVDAGVDVTLKAPALLQATELTLSNGKAEADVTIPEGANAVYYTVKSPEYAKYTVSGDANISMRKYLPNKDGNDYYYNGGTLEKDEIILIKVNAAGKLIITQDKINELELNKAKEITLKANESAVFMLPVFADGYYDFRVSDAKGLWLDADNSVYEDTVNRCYFAAYVNREESGDRYEFTVENTGEAEVKLTVTAGKLEFVDLKLGTTDVPVVKDRISITRFSAPEDYWYTVSCSAGSKLVEADGSVISETFLDEDDMMRGCLEYSGADAAGTAQVTVSKLEPASVSGDKIALSLEAGESKWYAYKTTAAGEYTFTAPQNVGLRIYRSLSSMNENFGPVKAGANAEIYIRVTNNSETKVEGEGAEVTVTCKAATELKVGEPVSITESGYSYFTFRAVEDGFYQFNVTNGSYDYYGKSVWHDKLSNNDLYAVKKGDVVYLRLFASTDAVITVTRVGDEGVLDYVNVVSGEYQWITFQAPTDGRYTFYSMNKAGDPKAWFFRNQDVGDSADIETLDTVSVYDGYGYDDDAGGDGNFMKNIPLQAGETIYIAVGHYGLSRVTSCGVYVTH